MLSQNWLEFIESMFDYHKEEHMSIPGLNLEEQLGFLQQEWDDVDDMYLDGETIGA